MKAEEARHCPDVGPAVGAGGLSEWQALALKLLHERDRGRGLHSSKFPAQPEPFLTQNTP